MNATQTVTQRIYAARMGLVPHTEVESLDQEHYGLAVYKVDGQEYAYADSEPEAFDALVASITDSLWAFKASFILGFNGEKYTDAEEKALSEMQGKLCEDANPIMLRLIGGAKKLADFARAAGRADGRGHFLATYDGNEDEQLIDDEYRYAYRIG